MKPSTPLPPMLQVALGAGAIAPILYFGIQLAVAPFYPGYNFLTQAASDLGASTYRYGAVFNVGALTVGGLLILASLGIGWALRRMGTPVVLIAFVVVTVLAGGISSLWAGLVPLPDPAHGGHPALAMLMIFTPLALTLALWRQPRVRPVLLLGVGIILALIPVMSGALPIDTSSYMGLIQRMLALAVFGSVGLSAWYLRTQVSARSG